MRRQTLILLPSLGGVLVALLGLAAYIHRSAAGARAGTPARTVAFGAVSVEVPEAFQALGRRQHEAWAIQEFQAPGVGLLQLAAEPDEGTPFEAACVRWFGLPRWEAGPVVYATRGRTWFFKALPFFGNGGLAMHKERKLLRITACFDSGGHRHWVELRTSHTFRPLFRVLSDLLATLRNPEGAALDPALGDALRRIPQESGWRFLMPLEALGLLPIVLGLLLVTVFWGVGRRSGRRPDLETWGRSYQEAHVEVGWIGPGRRKFMLAFVAVDADGLTLYTFGTPLLRIPRSALKGQTPVQEGWFPPPYLEIPLGTSVEFLKYRWAYAGMGRTRLRIYTAEAARLQAALAG